MVNIDEVLTRLGISRSTLYKRIRKGHFPKSHNPIRKGSAQWPLSVVTDWIAESKRKNRVQPRIAEGVGSDRPQSTKQPGRLWHISSPATNGGLYKSHRTQL